jgi:hypothetical protein
MVLRQLIGLRLCDTLVDKRIGRRELQTQQLAGTSSRIDRLVKVVPAEGHLETEVGGKPIPERSGEERIIVQIILRVVNGPGEGKEVIRPLELFA